jgi:hypothetical protein
MAVEAASPARRHGSLARRDVDETRGRASKAPAAWRARSALEKFAAVQMIDVHLPTTDGRELRLTHYTQPEPELQLLLKQTKLVLPLQPPGGAEPDRPCSAQGLNECRTFDIPDAFGYAYVQISGEAR